MAAKILALFIGLLCCSSCAFLPVSSNVDLLSAPILNKQQQEISRALTATVNLSDIIYKYPQLGENRSPFTFCDLSGDGSQDAVVFYANKDSPSQVRAKILTRDESGEWYTLHDESGRGDQVGFVTFTRLLFRDRDSMIIGWENTSGRPAKQLGIYSIRDGEFTREYVESYEAFTLSDFDSDGLRDIVISRSISGDYVLQLLRVKNGELAATDTANMYYETTGILQMLGGQLQDGSPAVYIDQILDNIFYATEIFKISGDSIETIVGSGNGNDSPRWKSYTSTFRDERVLSVDLDGDGMIEVPRLVDLPSVSVDEELRPPQLTQYMKLDGEALVTSYSAAVNLSGGYLVYFPDKWLDQVTVVAQPDISAWSFRKMNEDSGEPGAELLRIRVYSTLDFQDAFVKDDILLAEKGIFKYYAYIPKMEADEPLALTPDEVPYMFALL